MKIIPEIVETGIMIRWVIYRKQRRYAITAYEIALYTNPKTGKLQKIAKMSKL